MAQRFIVTALEEQCLKFLEKKLSAEVVVELLDGAIGTNHVDLQMKIMHWMLEHYLDLSTEVQNDMQQDHVWIEFYKLLSQS